VDKMEEKYDHAPKVFISYAWTSEFYTKRVVDLASRLMHDGIDVILDKWDLREGQDKYKFMEQSVSNPYVDKVLILCNPVYAERSNQREGGVGDETIIITPEVYSDTRQTKFIPIIFEKSLDGSAVTPIYLKSRIYIDLSDVDNNKVYEENYEQLIRNIWDRPQYEKPKIGKMPAWLESKDTNLILLEKLVNNYKAESSLTKKKYLGVEIIDEFIDRVRECDLEFIEDNNTVLYAISRLLPHRNLLLNYIETKVIEDDDNLSEFLINLFEDLYSKIGNGILRWEIPSMDEPRYYLIWELFICTAALLLKYRNYKVLFSITTGSYILSDKYKSESKTYVFFRPYFKELEKQSLLEASEYYRKISVPGAVLMGREKLPSLPACKIAEADEILTQLSFLLKPSSDNIYWFSYCYIYSQGTPIWQKLASKSFCDILMPFIGCKTYEELKSIIRERTPNSEYRLRESFKSISSILSCIQEELIATRI
jgi:hypothetical protein